MRAIAILFACLTCAGHGRRVHDAREHMQGSSHEEGRNSEKTGAFAPSSPSLAELKQSRSNKQVGKPKTMQVLSTLLAFHNPTAGYQMFGRSRVPHSRSLAVNKPSGNLAGYRPASLNRQIANVQMMADEDGINFFPLKARRSIVKYDMSKPVPEEVTNRALEAAILAPNHWLFEPWRFYTCGPETKEALRGLNEEKRKAAEGVPEMLVVTVASSLGFETMLGLENHAATAAAVQNFMLSLTADGLGSKWMTGALGVAPEDILSVIKAPDGEKLMGVIWYGYPAKPLSEDAKAPPRKKGLDGVVTRLP